MNEMKPTIAYGTAYNCLSSTDPPDTIPEIIWEIIHKLSRNESITEDERKIFYNSPSVKLSTRDDSLQISGKPIFIEHGQDSQYSKPVGTILNSTISKNNLDVCFNITDPNIAQRVKNKELVGLSINYSVQPNLSHPGKLEKIIKEVSLVSKPFFGGCGVFVAASNNHLIHKSNNKNLNLFNIQVALSLKSNMTSPGSLQESHINPDALKSITPEQLPAILKELKERDEAKDKEILELQKKHLETENQLKIMIKQEREKAQKVLDEKLAKLLGVEKFKPEAQDKDAPKVEGQEPIVPFFTNEEEYQAFCKIFNGEDKTSNTIFNKILDQINREYESKEKEYQQTLATLKTNEQPSSSNNNNNNNASDKVQSGGLGDLFNPVEKPNENQNFSPEIMKQFQDFLNSKKSKEYNNNSNNNDSNTHDAKKRKEPESAPVLPTPKKRKTDAQPPPQQQQQQQQYYSPNSQEGNNSKYAPPSFMQTQQPPLASVEASGRPRSSNQSMDPITAYFDNLSKVLTTTPSGSLSSSKYTKNIV